MTDISGSSGPGPNQDSRDRLVERLEKACGAGELRSPIVPERLGRGHWWSDRKLGEWPAALTGGVLEPKEGYRFRPENVAMVALLQGLEADTVVDLGCGSGSLLLIAAVVLTPRRLVGVDIQAESIERLKRTVAAHQLEHVDLLVGDLRRPEIQAEIALLVGGGAELVLMNPPYFPVGWGRTSRHEAVRLSTHGEQGDVRDFLGAAKRLVSKGGQIWAVYDAWRLAELLVAAGEVGLAVQRLFWIPDQRPGKGDRPYRFWAVLGRRGEAESGAFIERL
ncbi:MAG: methyltransferase [Bradymonadales bacterium]|nr:methyltransferase [Bradymonadales bacterium]